MATLIFVSVFADNHKVHFDVDDDLVGKDNEIIVQKKADKIDVHLGFLQINHRYKINFSIPKSLCESETGSQVSLQGVSNPHLQVISATSSQDLIDLHLELYAHKEKLMVEEFSFHLTDVTDPVTVALNARVLGELLDTVICFEDETSLPPCSRGWIVSRCRRTDRISLQVCRRPTPQTSSNFFKPSNESNFSNSSPRCSVHVCLPE
ncbi:hypothetical protein J6590_062026 [Homalodisca vitripennis]|nr:hypothetical protein J6590_062026 [Homalodisca vitripennis]